MSAGGAGKCCCKAILNSLGKIMVTTRRSWVMEKSKLTKTGRNLSGQSGQANYRPVSLISVPGKVRKQILPKYILYKIY